jgi:transposase
LAPLIEAHDCEWRDKAERLERELTDIKASLAVLQRAVFGKRSEKMPRIDEELRAEQPKPREATLNERRENRAARAALPERVIHHVVPAERRRCPKCGGADLRPLGDGKRTVVYEYVPARIERQVHVQETLSCRCGEGIITADAPKAIENGHYGPGLIAHLVTAKCCDSVPLYRQAKAYAREGVPIARTTMGDLFHAAAAATEPLWKRLLELVREAPVVHADETPQRVLAEGKTRRAYAWTFRTEDLVAFVHSATRSGETPLSILSGTKGHLVVDGYTGYNRVTLPDGRVRVGCWAHTRRRFFDALPTAPEAQQMLDFILALYRVEHEVKAAVLAGTDEHLRRRELVSAEVVKQIEQWLARELPKHPPKSPLGEAIRYAQGQWTALTQFLGNASLPLDNNSSERALRAVALGRKNYLFVGSDTAGENLAGLHSLIATCEANGINPEAYLADVLMRVNTHLNSRIDDLLPHRWRATATVDSS